MCGISLSHSDICAAHLPSHGVFCDEPKGHRGPHGCYALDVAWWEPLTSKSAIQAEPVWSRCHDGGCGRCPSCKGGEAGQCVHGYIDGKAFCPSCSKAGVDR